jgi:twinkle protein
MTLTNRTSADAVKAALLRRAEEFVRWLLPNGHKEGHEWLIGSLRGEPGQSCRVVISGAKAGVFIDWATGEKGGNLVELLKQVRRCDFREALRQCRVWLGL